MKIITRTIIAAAAILTFCAVVGCQNRFEGYSLTVDADSSDVCPVRWLSSVGEGNAIDVYISGTNQRTPAVGLAACQGSEVRSGNHVLPNGEGKWCFSGAEPFYDIKLRNNMTYLWYPITRTAGFYNVKDFRPVTRTPGPTPQYVFNDPADYTRTIRNAVAFIASRQGGTLQFPDGDYVVGTTDGNTRDPQYQAITLPSGIIIEGASSNSSLTTTNLPIKTSSTRIRLRNTNQTIFRIGGCTEQVAVRNIELLGNSALYGEQPRDATGNYGIEGVGKWTIRPADKPNTSQIFTFENITFQNLDRGIYVHNANDERCNASEQNCSSWQFDYVKVDHGIFLTNRTAIWIDTFNTDWKITNSLFYYIAAMAPGDGIHVKKAGTMLVEQSFGGGNDYGGGIGGTFIHIDTIGSLTVINSGSERGRRSLYMNPAGATTSVMLNVIGSIFDDPVELNGRVNYISSGNFYGAKTIKADPSVMITSNGDRFCYDPTVLPGRCRDQSGASVSNPGFGGGRIMFQTGRPGEGSGNDRIEGRANYFGYNVQIGDGLMQFDPNIGYRDITNWVTDPTRPRLSDGALVYCKDCRRGGVCSQGTAGVDGAFAKRINGKWLCD